MKYKYGKYKINYGYSIIRVPEDNLEDLEFIHQHYNTGLKSYYPYDIEFIEEVKKEDADRILEGMMKDYDDLLEGKALSFSYSGDIGILVFHYDSGVGDFDINESNLPQLLKRLQDDISRLLF